MIDFASTHAWIEGVAPTASCDEGYIEATAARLPKASHPPTADGGGQDVMPTGRDSHHHCCKTSRVCPLASV
jgi:hypothetical protein